MVIRSGNIGEYKRNDLLVLYYNTWQNIIIYVFKIYSHPVYIYGFQINLKPRSLSWARCDFQTMNWLWHISTWHPPNTSYITRPISPHLAFSILGNGIPILTQLPKHKPRSYLPVFWKLPSVVPSSPLLVFSPDRWYCLLCFINIFRSSSTLAHLHWYCLCSNICHFLPKHLC